MARMRGTPVPRGAAGLWAWSYSLGPAVAARASSVAGRRGFLSAATFCSALFLAAWAFSVPDYLAFLSAHPLRGRGGAAGGYAPELDLLGWTGALSSATVGLRMAVRRQFRWAAVVLVTSALPAALLAYLLREWVLELRRGR